MATTVDSKILEMRFDNKNFESGVQTTMHSLDKLQQSLDMRGATQGLNNVSNAVRQVNFSGMSSAVDSVKMKFSALEVAAVTALANITNSAVNAGKRMVKSLTIEPISQGFSEYELKMGSIQTIMASTGESLETVNGYLNELNTYSDRTIYSFSDMTQNIGKFTNSGVKLHDAVKAIQGISNEAAISGANTNEASRAMYNFAQALSSGAVRLMDWKSIELANMGTVEFKNELLKTAVALGTVKQDGDKFISTTTDMNGHISQAFNSMQGFNDSLSSQWLTTEVLVETLGRYSDETTDLGKRAFQAATELKTFHQLLDTLKESAGSGWATTWEILFGNFEEAKKLWTDINNVVGKIISDSADHRNAVLGAWKEMGGRKAIIDGMVNAFHALVKVLTPVKEAFREFFPQVTAEQLFHVTEQFRDFTDKLQLSDNASKNLKNTFRGLFAVLDIIKQAFVALVKLIFPMTSGLDDLGGGILSVTGSMGAWLVELNHSIEKSELFVRISDGIKKACEYIANAFKALGSAIAGALGPDDDQFNTSGFEKLGNVLSKLWDILTDLSAGAGEKISNIIHLFEPLTNVISNAADKLKDALSLDNFTMLFNSAVLASIGKAIYEFFDVIKDSIEKFSSIEMKSINIFNRLGAIMAMYQSQLQAGTLLTIASAIGILAGSLVAISMIDSKKLGASTIAIGALMAMLTVTAKSLSKDGPLVIKGARNMIEFAIAIKILGSACADIATLSVGDMVKGLAGVGVLLGETSLFLNNTIFSKGAMSSATGILILSQALVKMAAACDLFGAMDIPTIVKGLSSIGVLLGEISLFVNSTGNASHVIATGAALVEMAYGMNIFAQAISALGALSLEEIAKGLGSMAGVLISITTAMNFMPKNMPAIGAGLLGVSVAISSLSNSLASLGSMSMEEIGHGLLILGGALAELSIGLNLMSGTLAGSAALMTAAAGIAVLTPSLVILAQLSLPQIGTGLIAIAGAFGVLGGAGLLLGPLVPVILGLAGAMALIGASVLGLGAGLTMAGAGLTAMAAGITALAGAGAVSAASFVATLKTIILGFVDLIPQIMVQFGEGLVSLVTFIGESAADIATALGNVFLAILTFITENLPSFVDAGLKIVLAFLQGIAENIYGIVTSFMDIITQLILAIADRLPELIDAGFKMVIAFIDGISQACIDNAAALRDAFINLFKAMLEAILVFFGIHSPSKVFADIGTNLILGLINGVKNMASNAINVVRTLANNLSQAIKNKFGEFLNNGKTLISNLANGIRNTAGTVVSNVRNMMSNAINNIASHVGSFRNKGSELIHNLASGISNAAYNAASAASNVLWSVINAIDSGIESFATMGWNMMIGLANGVWNAAQQVVDAVVGVVDNAKEWAKSILGINSPSKEFEIIGKFTDMGFVEGLLGYSDKVKKSAAEMANEAMAAAYSVADDISNAIDRNSDLQPVITPVVDMSNVDKNASEIDNLFGLRNTMALAYDVASLQNNHSNVQEQSSWFMNNADIVEAINALKGYIERLGLSMSNLKVMLDTGTLVGSIADPMNMALGEQSIFERRGVK